MITQILVRPAARGGKYLGPDAANPQIKLSALVYLSDVETGEIVAATLVDTTGMEAGPATLMAPVSRATPYATDATTVSALLEVDIDVPTTFKVTVLGPLSHIDQARACTADITVLPGVNIGTSAGNPEGLVLEVPGLCISGVTAVLDGPTLSCDAVVTMMCGCKISDASGSYWPPANFTVQLVTLMESQACHTYELAFNPPGNATSSFCGQWPSQAAPGDTVQKAWLLASEPSLGNQGQYQIKPASPLRLPFEVEALLARTGVL